MMRNDYRSVYIAFAPHPSCKGASTHLQPMCETLVLAHAPLLLLTLKGDQDTSLSDHIHHYVFESGEPNILKRAEEFRQWVKEILSQQFNLMVAHFRDIWGGMAVFEFPHIRSVFEVNGLPSIELPYRYPDIAEETLQKIMRMEQHCFAHAGAVITPSQTTKECLMTRGCTPAKITVIPNGAIIPVPLQRREDLPEKYMVYVGALQPWQGVDILLKSLRYLQDITICLVICSSHMEHHTKPFRKLAEKLGVENSVRWLYQLDKENLNRVLQHALFSLAPLTECSRNIEQGCSPLKILESMACGTPVIASQLPAVEEIITHQQDGMLCRPGRPAELGRTIRIALDYPEHTAQLGVLAKQRIQQHFTWQHAKSRLAHVYESIFTFSY